MADVSDANQRWAQMLAHWAIPDAIVAAAPATPYFFDPQVFIRAADEALARTDDTPSDDAAREALHADGTVLDVACGAGAASLRLRPGRVVGVDPSSPLLEAFAARASGLGIDCAIVEGAWPAAAAQTPTVDVVLCHHVVYNVTDLSAFADALRDHARRRVVIELTAVHPMAWMTPYWEALYGLGQPDRPVAEDAIAVLEDLGLTVHQQRWQRHYQMIGETGHEALERIARRLCLPESRHEELRELLAITPPPRDREMVTLWW
jgi:SAM-dependent methyltransferase